LMKLQEQAIGPGLDVCHLETGAQVITPAQIGPQKVVEALQDTILNALKNNIEVGTGCSQIVCMMANDIGAMLIVSTEMNDSMPESLDALHAAGTVFAEGTGNAKTQWELQNKGVT
jgi:hypothetical protein